MLQGNLCSPKLSWLSLHCPMAVHYLFMCWSMEYNNSSNSTENAFLIQCRDSERGMKNGFQPLQELAAAASQESPRNPSLLLISLISFLGYRPTHASDGNSGQGQLGGNLVPRAIVLLLGLLHGCRIAACGGGGTRRSSARLAAPHRLCLPYWCSCACFALLCWKSYVVTKVSYKLRVLLDFQ